MLKPGCTHGDLPRPAAGFRAVSGVRRVVGVAGPGAAGAGRLHDRIARDRGAPRDAWQQARARYGLDGRSARSTATGWRVPRGSISAARSSTTGPCRDLIPERAANTAVARADGARPCHPHRPAARRRDRQPPRQRPVRVGSRGLAPSAVDAAPPDVALPDLRGGAHRLAADCRHAIGGRSGSGVTVDLLRHLDRAGARRWRCRWRRCSSGCSRRRWRMRSASRSFWPPAPAAFPGRASSGATR